MEFDVYRVPLHRSDERLLSYVEADRHGTIYSGELLGLDICVHVSNRYLDDELNCRKTSFVMAAICNKAGRYIFALWFLSIFLSFFLSSFFFSSRDLSDRRFKLDVYHTSTRGVALVRI